MPNKCVRCGKVYDKGSPELLKGCGCGSRVFVYLKRMPAAGAEKEAQPDLGWLEKEMAFLAKDKPVVVDADAIENLRILEPGRYELDVASLMRNDPLVIKSDKDVYYIKLPPVRKKD